MTSTLGTVDSTMHAHTTGSPSAPIPDRVTALEQAAAKLARDVDNRIRDLASGGLRAEAAGITLNEGTSSSP